MLTATTPRENVDVINDLMLKRCTSDKADDGSKYLATFIVSRILQTFGSIPLYVLGITYLDDASSRGTAAVHMGIYIQQY